MAQLRFVLQCFAIRHFIVGMVPTFLRLLSPVSAEAFCPRMSSAPSMSFNPRRGFGFIDYLGADNTYGCDVFFRKTQIGHLTVGIMR